MSLLPSSRPEAEATQEGDLRLLGFDDDVIDDVLNAISSETARALLREIHDEPQTPSELADRMDSSLQNVSYHLENLEGADLIQVVATQYSEKGREMKVYGPADEPMVMFVGTDERKRGLRALLQRFVGATSLLAVVSVLLHSFIEGSLPYVSFTGAGGDGAGGAGAVAPTLPLATAVFLGGFVMLILLFGWWYWEPEVDGLLARIWNTPLLGGRDRALSRRAAILTVGGSVALAVVWLGLRSFEIVIPAVGPIGPAPAFGLALIGAAAIQAYYNDGLVISWLIVFVPIAVFGLGIVGIGLAGEGLDRIAGIIGYPVLIGIVGALVLGTGGFVLGAGLRRVVSQLSRIAG